MRCTRCPRLRSYCARVARDKKREFRDWEYWGRPVPGFGDPAARLLVVGLAPAAHGANRTGRMFTGDSSGNIGAAARCAPPGNKPSRTELERCRPYLETELRLLEQLRVVIALGRIAHDAWLQAAGWWSSLAPRERPPFRHGAVARLPDGTILISSYHPSRQNTNTGKLTRAMWYAVFRKARRMLGDSRSP